MSLRPPAPRIPLALALALAGGWLGASLNAQEPARTSTPAPASTSPQSIDSAKKDFDALKAARDAAQRGQGTAVPRVTLPELQTGLGDPRPAPGAKASPALDPTKKSANWLVEGMAREAARRDVERGRTSNSNSNSRDRREISPREDRAGGDTSADGVAVEASPTDPQSRLSSARESRDIAAAEKQKSAEAPNPLNRYLAEWMTPRDYATLKPSLTDGLAADSVGRGLNDISLPASMGGGLSGINLPGGLTPPGTEPFNSGPKAPIAPPRENPYLQSFALPPAPAINLSAPPPPPAPGPALSPMPSPTPTTPVAKPAVPDFARPAQDEKYFKQLKRF